MMTWNNTLFYCCECVGFVLFRFTVLFCECILLCVWCHLMFIDVFHMQMQLMQRLDQWNEYVCVYVCMYVSVLHTCWNQCSVCCNKWNTVHIHVKASYVLWWRASGDVVVKTLRYYSHGPGINFWWCHRGFFSVAPSDRAMCSEVDSASENEHQRFLLG